jgi:ATP-dependent Lon protease
VRELARLAGTLARKVVRSLVEKGSASKKVTLSVKDVDKMLGPDRYSHQNGETQDQIGVVTGLAWTPVGGETLPIEVSRMPGRGKLILTGSLGEVMRESAQAALSYARAYVAKQGAEVDLSKEDIHIHVPSGAMKKDGPSAGIALTTALISLFLKRPVRHDVAMTGEVTLRGKVMEIGGLKEKSLAALRSGITTIVYPFENKRDLVEMPKEAKQKITFVPVKTIDDVLGVALRGPHSSGRRFKA